MTALKGDSFGALGFVLFSLKFTFIYRYMHMFIQLVVQWNGKHSSSIRTAPHHLASSYTPTPVSLARTVIGRTTGCMPPGPGTMWLVTSSGRNSLLHMWQPQCGSPIGDGEGQHSVGLPLGMERALGPLRQPCSCGHSAYGYHQKHCSDAAYPHIFLNSSVTQFHAFITTYTRDR